MLTPDQTAALRKATKIPALTTATELETLGAIDPVLKAWAAERRDAALHAANASQAKANLTHAQLADVIVTTLKDALGPRDATIEALRQDVRALTDRVLELEAQGAAVAHEP